MKRVLLALGVIAMTCATDAHADEGVTIAQFYSYCKKGPSHVDGAYCAGYMTGYADLGMIGRSTEVYGVAASIRYLRRELLARLLTHRFGTLPASVQQRLAAASAETLLAWTDRVLTAPTLDDVLAD